jgi:small-conductance mechanosensitive channel
VVKEAVGEVPGLVAEPAPSVAFDPGFGENGIGLSVNYQVDEFANQGPVRNLLRRRIFAKFKELGIDVPYPARMVYLRGDGRRERAQKSLQPGAEEKHR